jgi:hypothetical protein
MRIDSAEGALIGKTSLTKTEKPEFPEITVPVKPTYGRHDLYLIFKNGSANNGRLAGVDWVLFNNKKQ